MPPPPSSLAPLPPPPKPRAKGVPQLLLLFSLLSLLAVAPLSLLLSLSQSAAAAASPLAIINAVANGRPPPPLPRDLGPEAARAASAHAKVLRLFKRAQDAQRSPGTRGRSSGSNGSDGSSDSSSGVGRWAAQPPALLPSVPALFVGASLTLAAANSPHTVALWAQALALRLSPATVGDPVTAGAENAYSEQTQLAGGRRSRAQAAGPRAAPTLAAVAALFVVVLCAALPAVLLTLAVQRAQTVLRLSLPCLQPLPWTRMHAGERQGPHLQRRGSFEVALALAVLPVLPPAAWMAPCIVLGFPARSLLLAMLLGNTPWVCLHAAAIRTLPARLEAAALYMQQCRDVLAMTSASRGWRSADVDVACWDAYEPDSADGLVANAWQLQLAFGLAVALPLLFFKTHHTLLWARG